MEHSAQLILPLVCAAVLHWQCCSACIGKSCTGSTSQLTITRRTGDAGPGVVEEENVPGVGGSGDEHNALREAVHGTQQLRLLLLYPVALLLLCAQPVVSSASALFCIPLELESGGCICEGGL